MFWKWIWCIVTNMVLFFSFFLKPFSIHPKIHQKINKIRTFTKFDPQKTTNWKIVARLALKQQLSTQSQRKVDLF